MFRTKLLSYSFAALLFVSTTVVKADENIVSCPKVELLNAQSRSLSYTADLLWEMDAGNYDFWVTSEPTSFYDPENKLWWIIAAAATAPDKNTAIASVQDQIRSVNTLDPIDQPHAERFEDRYNCEYFTTDLVVNVEVQALDKLQK
ncbi:MAG: hypothetical protein V4501_04070 [Pseudomonadota bacterium]